MTTRAVENRPPLIWWWVALPSAGGFVVGTRNNWVRRVPRSALNLLGRPWPPNAEYLRQQGATIIRIGEVELNGNRAVKV